MASSVNHAFGCLLKNKNGYPLMLETCVGYKKAVNVGKLVLDAWEVPQTVDDRGDLRTEVDHIDRNCQNNNLENLRWATRHENVLNRRNINPYWLHTPEMQQKKKQSWERKRQLRKDTCPWLHTEEAMNKRRKTIAARKANKNR